MSSVDVSHLRILLERHSGLDLGRGGMEVNLVNFVRQRLAANRLTFQRYLEQLELPGSEELRLLIETMTVVYTWFFRDPGQFQVIEQLLRDFSSERKMGIWVAGCATGEEPYSVALVAAELAKPVDILGTDLNSKALGHAKLGRYSVASLQAVDAAMRSRYLQNATGDFQVPETAKQSVRFQLGNLVEAAPRSPSAEGWDLVICRNVLIYFGPEQARRTLDNLASCLAPGGTLILGASEAILERPTSLNVVGVAGRAVLRRPKPGESHSSSPRLVPAAPSPVAGQLCRSARVLRESVDETLPLTAKKHEQDTVLGSAASAAALARTPPRFELPNHSIATTAHSALQQGHSALDAGQIPTAREYYLHAVSLDPTCAEALMFAGIAHYLDGALDDALSQLRGALCLDASLWAACFYQALCYENMGYAEDAARSYSQVVKLVGDHPGHSDEHPFLKGWRHDLLAVAKKRAHVSTNLRAVGDPHRLRAQR